MRCITCNGIGSCACSQCNGTGDLLKCDCSEWLLHKEREDLETKIKDAKDDQIIFISFLGLISLILVSYLYNKKDSPVALDKKQQPKTAQLQKHTADNISNKTSTAPASAVPKVIPVRPPELRVESPQIDRPKYKIPQGVPPDSPKYYSMPQRENFQRSKVNPKNAGDENVDPTKQYSKVDKQLNDAYKNVMARLDTQGKESLRFEQRNWIKNRDAAAAVARDPSEAQSIILIRTIARTRELERYR